ncbi:hypothetical protein HNR11_001961 [Nesterenkonia sandarakina]|uniref:Uncharacterized protein n=1 Tax=Nesterenkonia sandarakina TaxID=272918 RepID=A0A7Z0E9A8_9MICC|nr:hypothetical protein [Nesterenkonia sandarakina]
MIRTENARESRRSVSRNVWIAVGLVAFVAVDILLVALALGWGRDVPQTADWQASSEISPPAEDHSEDIVDEPQSPPEPDEAQTAPRLLSVVSETVAWRSEGGACEERAEIELTIDGGETWGAAYPAADGLGRPLWLSGADYTAVQAAIASGDDCSAYGVRTYDSGATWTREDQVIENSVFIDPRDSSVMVWSGERIQGPCNSFTQVAVTGGVASAVCQDGSLWNLDSQNRSWDETGIDAVVAVSGSDGRRVAALESAECDGLALVEFGNESVQPISCVANQPGETTAVDLQGETLWVWAGDQVSVSASLGRDLNS